MERKEFLRKSAFTFVAASFANWTFAAEDSNQEEVTNFRQQLFNSQFSYTVKAKAVMNNLTKGESIIMDISRVRLDESKKELNATLIFNLREDYNAGYRTSISINKDKSDFTKLKGYDDNFINNLLQIRQLKVLKEDDEYRLDFLNRYSDSMVDLPEFLADCYLTSICVEHKQLLDNCYELTTLRNFRDQYMRKSNAGTDLVNDYYSLGPSLLHLINQHKHRTDILDYLYENLISKSIHFIEENQLELAMNYYKEFTIELNHRLRG